MNDSGRAYIAIDLKSFYASAECVERGLDPLDTHLVVADASRTDGTICLAVSPPLKSYGVPGRARLWEARGRAREINACRLARAPGHMFRGESYLESALRADSSLMLRFIVAPPRMALYIEYSTRIYAIYLRYFSSEDISVYSIDEVFIDATPYLALYGLTARELAVRLSREVLAETGITATVGIGTSLYLAKVAMDIEAKHIEPDGDGARIAELDEMSYRRRLWTHRPITDFWRVGSGYAERLKHYHIYTMGDIARCSVEDEGLLYRLFGVNAELLIDHAWGWEPCTMADIREYRPRVRSLSSGQVLPRPYSYDEARLIVWEMTESLALSLVEKGLMTDRLVLTVGYDTASLADPSVAAAYRGEISLDHYGRPVPRHAHGTGRLSGYTSSSGTLVHAAMDLFTRIADPMLSVRRITLVCDRVRIETAAGRESAVQLTLFGDAGTSIDALWRERALQEAVISLRRRYGKNAVLKARNLSAGATAILRNTQIGGHRA